MSSIASVSPSAAQTAQTVAASGADGATAGLGLPPVGLAQAASINTVNAELVTSQFGVDPASVAGVYGGAAQSGSNWFTNVDLLPALSGLSASTAEQALSLFGFQVPTVGNPSVAQTSAGTSSDPSADAGTDSATPDSSSIGAAVVDPLWGKDA